MSDDRLVRAAYARLCGEWSMLSNAERAARLDGFSVRFAYNSGRIENRAITEHDTREVFRRKRVASFSGELKTLYEIDNQRVAWAWMVSESRGRTALSAGDVLEAHRLLTRMTYDDDLWASGERPGTFKRGDFGVGVDQEVGYAPEDVADAVRGLCEEVSEAMGRGPGRDAALTIGCYAHAMIAEIHPFADGNGRCARLVENLVRLSLGQPPSIVLESDRAAYYGALDAFHQDGRLDDLRAFCMAECVRASLHGEAMGTPGRGPRAKESPTLDELAGTLGGAPLTRDARVPRGFEGGGR